MHKKFCHLDFFFCSYYAVERAHFHEHSENGASRANDYVTEFDLTKLRLLPCTLLMMTSDFVTDPECVKVKQQSRELTAHNCLTWFYSIAVNRATRLHAVILSKVCLLYR